MLRSKRLRRSIKIGFYRPLIFTVVMYAAEQRQRTSLEMYIKGNGWRTFERRAIKGICRPKKINEIC